MAAKGRIQMDKKLIDPFMTTPIERDENFKDLKEKKNSKKKHKDDEKQKKEHK